MEYNTNIEKDSELQNKSFLSFFGKGSTYFGIVALNLILTIITLGLYYPWAKAAYRKYLWNETEFKGSRFVFHGTGRQMFKGFIIAILLLLLVYGAFIYIQMQIVTMVMSPVTGVIILLLLILLLVLFIPFAIYGAYRFRVKKTSWRGVYFQFSGKLGEFIKLYFIQLLLTILTFGIYGFWMRTKIQKYLFSHTSIGDLQLDFHGTGGTLFGISILGNILTVITLGLFLPIYIKQRFEFTINNTTIEENIKRRALKSHLTNKEAWVVIFTNFLLLIVTLGLAFPWVLMRQLRMYFNSIEIPSEFDYDALEQTGDPNASATGDELADIMDIGLDF